MATLKTAAGDGDVTAFLDGLAEFTEKDFKRATQLFGEAAGDLSNVISDLLWGVYSDAVFSYGENTREVASQEYFQLRLRQMVELALPDRL